MALADVLPLTASVTDALPPVPPLAPSIAPAPVAAGGVRRRGHIPTARRNGQWIDVGHASRTTAKSTTSSDASVASHGIERGRDGPRTGGRRRAAGGRRAADSTGTRKVGRDIPAFATRGVDRASNIRAATEHEVRSRRAAIAGRATRLTAIAARRRDRRARRPSGRAAKVSDELALPAAPATVAPLPPLPPVAD